MKKVLFLFAAMLLLSGSMFAQKKNVSIAKARMGAETPDLKAANEAIKLALADSVTKKLASTWFLAGEISYAMYLDQRAKILKEATPNKTAMINAVDNTIKYLIVADSLDQLPDLKGRIKPKYHAKIVERVKGLQPELNAAAGFYYEKKDYKNAVKYFESFLNFPEIGIMKEFGLEKDTMRTKIQWYTALAATQGEMPEIADKYYEIVKDSTKSYLEPKYIYQQLINDYTKLKDTVNMLRMLKLGTKKFPEESYYVKNLINYYLMSKKLDEALTWVDEAIKQDDSSAVLWNLKGRIIESDSLAKVDKVIECYKKAIELDPTLAEPYGNIGRIFYNYAVTERLRIYAIRDDKKFKTEKLKLKPLFEIPLPYYEKAYKINPNERDYIVALRNIYYQLENSIKFKDMDEKLNNF